jgi:hypothetical protein
MIVPSIIISSNLESWRIRLTPPNGKMPQEELREIKGPPYPFLKIGLLDSGHIHADRLSRTVPSPNLAISIRGF